MNDYKLDSRIQMTKLPDLNTVDYSTWKYCKRRTKRASLIWRHWNSNTENGTGQAGSRHHYCSSHSSVASL